MAELAGEFHFQKSDDPTSPDIDTQSQSSSDASLPSPHKKEAAENNVPTKKPVRFFTSLCEYPKNVSFDSQDEDEEIILLMRRSFMTNVPWIFLVVLLALLPPFVTFLPLSETFPDVSPLTVAVGVAFYYLLLFGAVLVNFSLWYFHVGLVTNKRVIDIDIHGILIRHVSETRLHLLQDVSYKQIGFISSLFRYGDVHVQTAATHQNVEFDRIPRPLFVREVIGDLIGKMSQSA